MRASVEPLQDCLNTHTQPAAAARVQWSARPAEAAAWLSPLHFVLMNPACRPAAQPFKAPLQASSGSLQACEEGARKQLAASNAYVDRLCQQQAAKVGKIYVSLLPEDSAL